MPLNLGDLSSKVFQRSNNPMNRIIQAERAIRDQAGANKLPAGDPDQDDHIGGRYISPDEDTSIDANGNLISEPTDAGFTGAFQSGRGETFGGIVYQFGAVLAGVLGVGFNKFGQFLAGAGAIVLDAYGQSITGTGVLFKFTNGSSFGMCEIIPLGGVFFGLFSGVAIKTVLDSDFNSGAFGSGWSINAGSPAYINSFQYPGSSYSMNFNANSESILSDYIAVSPLTQHYLDFWVYPTTGRVLNFNIEYFDAGSVSLSSTSFQINYTGVITPTRIVYLFNGKSPSTATKAKLTIGTIGVGGTASINLQKVSLYECTGILIRNNTIAGPSIFVDDATFQGSVAATGTVTGSNISGSSSGTNTGDETTASIASKSIEDAINNGTTDKAPSENAVFDALGLKAPLASPTFTGSMTLNDAGSPVSFNFNNGATVRGLIGIPEAAGQYAGGSAAGDIVLRTTASKLIFDTNTGSGTSSLTIQASNGMVQMPNGYGANAPVTETGATRTLSAADNNLICNRAGTITLTLPTPSAANAGKIITIKTIQAQLVISASSNVVPENSATAGTAILAATAGKWADLVSDGATNWIIMRSN